MDFKCDTCEKYFGEEQYLKKHIKTIHEKIIVLYVSGEYKRI